MVLESSVLDSKELKSTDNELIKIKGKLTDYYFNSIRDMSLNDEGFPKISLKDILNYDEIKTLYLSGIVDKIEEYNQKRKDYYESMNKFFRVKKEIMDKLFRI